MKKLVFSLLLILSFRAVFSQKCGNNECESGELQECPDDCKSVLAQIESMKAGQNMILIFILAGSGVSGALLIAEYMGKKKKGSDVEEFLKRKEAQTQAKPQAELIKPIQPQEYVCPNCKQKIIWVQQYKRWYCPNEKKYL